MQLKRRNIIDIHFTSEEFTKLNEIQDILDTLYLDLREIKNSDSSICTPLTLDEVTHCQKTITLILSESCVDEE